MPMKGIKRLSHNVHGFLRSGTIFFDLPRVVEELVYNSVDAGSTRVVVFISIKACYVKVEDDGCGITRDGLVVLGERFATSKIHHVADGGISTEALGFRGEAFSSLSDISLVEIRSKARGKPNAYCKVMKSSKCLFLGIDDQRDDVGTTVTLRDLFYNQPIRRKYMQSSPKKVLHCLKKCVFRIALVHPQILFKVFEIDSEDKLLCTAPSSSSLPLVIDGFGNEVSCKLHEIEYHDRFLSLTGHISGPMDAFSIKALQYIYINSRFVSRGPIHNLINSLARNFQSSTANWRDNFDKQCWKRQKTQGYLAFLLNLCCPNSIYDLNFEPSKTTVQFKEWGVIFSFIEEAITRFWKKLRQQQQQQKQLASHLFQGKTSVCKTSHEAGNLQEGLFPESIMEKDLFTEGITNKSKLMEKEHSSHFHEHSLSGPQCTNRMEISFGDTHNHQKHSLSCKGQADSVLQCNIFKNEDNHVQVANTFLEREVDNLEDTLDAHCVQSTCMKSYKQDTADLNPSPLQYRLSECIPGEILYENNISDTKILEEDYSLRAFEPCGIDGESFQFPENCFSVSCHAYTKGDSHMDNEIFSSSQCSSGFGFDDNLVCIKELFSDKGEFMTLANWKSKYVNTSHDLTFQKNISNDLPEEIMNSSWSATGVIRKCQTSRALETPLSCTVSPFSYDKECLTKRSSLSRGHLSGETESSFGSSVHFDFFNDFTSKQDRMNSKHSGYRLYAMEENNVEFLDSDLDTSCEILPDLKCMESTKYVRKICTSPGINLQDDYPLEQFLSTKIGSCYIMNEDKLYLPLESCSIENCGKYSHNLLHSSIGNHADAVEISCDSKEFQTEIQKLRLRRSQSAPPFYEGKKKIPILKSRRVDVFGESTGKVSHGQNGQLECGVLQPYVKPIEDLSRACSRELNREESNELIQIKNGPVIEELEKSSALLTKWRTGNPPPQDDAMSYNCFEQKGDILDITSGLLQLTGNSLVPESLSKVCLDDAKVLLQVDRKFIPAVASGTLVIIDQHAADERIRLEQLREKVLRGELCSITYLDVERELVLLEMGYQLLLKFMEQIKKWGWICNIHSQSDSFARNLNFLRKHKCRATLVAVPRILGIDLSEKDLLEYLKQLLETDGSSIIPPSVVRILNFKACRGAIMFGDALLPTECSLIVEELKSTSLCFQCAHGRPTIVPLLNLASLREQLARLGMREAQLLTGWHGLRHHPSTVQRARHRLKLS